MEDNEIGCQAQRFVDQLGLSVAVTAECVPDWLRVGEKGDERHVGKVVMLSIAGGNWRILPDWQTVLAGLSTRITNEIEEVNSVVMEVIPPPGK